MEHDPDSEIGPVGPPVEALVPGIPLIHYPGKPVVHAANHVAEPHAGSLGEVSELVGQHSGQATEIEARREGKSDSEGQTSCQKIARSAFE